MAEPEPFSNKILHPLIVVLSALIGLAILPRLVPARDGMVGKPAPDVTLMVAANGDVGSSRRLAELKGRPVLLDFWASWCGPCALAAPVIERVARRYEEKGLVVMGVNADDAPEIIQAYAAHKRLSYEMILDADRHMSARFGVDKLPTLVVIDRRGNVHAYLTGAVDEAALNEIVTAAL